MQPDALRGTKHNTFMVERRERLCQGDSPIDGAPRPYRGSPDVRIPQTTTSAHLERLRRGDSAIGGPPKPCLERVMRRAPPPAVPVAAPPGPAAPLPAASPPFMALAPASVRTSTLVVAGTTRAKALATIQLSAPSAALRAAQCPIGLQRHLSDRHRYVADALATIQLSAPSAALRAAQGPSAYRGTLLMAIAAWTDAWALVRPRAPSTRPHWPAVAPP